MSKARTAGITLAVSRELWFPFVAVLFRLGCPTHLIVFRFADAFFEHLRTLAPSLGIFIFSEGICCLSAGRTRHGIPTLRFGYGFPTFFLRIRFRFSRQLTFCLLIIGLRRFGRRMTVNRGQLARTGFNHRRRHRPDASSVLHYNTFVQRIFSHNLISSYSYLLELRDEHSDERRREHHSLF